MYFHHFFLKKVGLYDQIRRYLVIILLEISATRRLPDPFYCFYTYRAL